jgi:hypothetical protein
MEQVLSPCSLLSRTERTRGRPSSAGESRNTRQENDGFSGSVTLRNRLARQGPTENLFTQISERKLEGGLGEMVLWNAAFDNAGQEETNDGGEMTTKP